MASKVYYHLGSFEDSLTYALGAGDLFDVNDKSQYVETIIGESAVQAAGAEELAETGGPCQTSWCLACRVKLVDIGRAKLSGWNGHIGWCNC